MEEQWTLEKLGGHMYRLHQLWDGTPEMLDWLKEKGFSASSDGSDDYYHDFEEDNDHFNFGASMSECLQVLLGNQHFCTAFFLALAMGNKDARFGKQQVETKDPIDILFPVMKLMRIDNFLYLIAKNYNKSLGDQAKEMYQMLPETEFVDWLKSVVKPRFSGNVTSEEIRQYLVFDENPFKGINFLDAFYDSWCCVEENAEAFLNWGKTNEIPMKNPAEVFNDIILQPDDETTKKFAWCFWFGGDSCACHLFSMLNSEVVSIGVKSLLRETLTDYGKGDVEFAKQLQYLYDEYRAIIREGVNIIFYETTETDTTAQQTPQIEGPEQEQPKQAPKVIDETRQNLFKASKELIEVIVDFIAEDYEKKFIVDYFERMLNSSKYKNDSMKLVNELAYNSSKYEYKGLKVMHFCHIIGFLIAKGVIIDKPIDMARKIYPKLDRYPKAKSDPQNNDDIEEKRIDSIRLYIQNAKGFFAGKPRKTIVGHNFMQKVFDDMPKKAHKKPKTT